MFELALPCFYHTEETSDLLEAGLHFSYKDCNVREVIFYQVGIIAALAKEEGAFTEIKTAGYTVICALPVDVVRERVRQTYLKAAYYGGNS